MKASTWASIAVAALLLLLGSVFVVREGQTAIVLNLGKVVRVDLGPGLHFKVPLIESARIFDRRLQVLDAEAERYLTSERKDVKYTFTVLNTPDVNAFAVPGGHIYVFRGLIERTGEGMPYMRPEVGRNAALEAEVRRAAPAHPAQGGTAARRTGDTRSRRSHPSPQPRTATALRPSPTQGSARSAS